MKLAVVYYVIYPKHLIVFGIEGDLLKLFGIFFNERKQKVFVNGVLSYEAGVP